MRDGISHVTLNRESLLEKSQKDQSMSKLPKKIRNDINKEATDWDCHRDHSGTITRAGRAF